MNKIERLYQKLKKKHGKPKGQWSLWCKKRKTEEEREEVIIGAILTQRTNWKNVMGAIENLKQRDLCSLKKIMKRGEEEISQLIKPTGFYEAKAGYLFGLAEFVVKNYGSIAQMKKERQEVLREKLLKLRGIGFETADSILLYALDKPIFVVDEYTRRLANEYRLSENLSYHFLQNLFEKNLKRDWRLYQDLHALIVIEEKQKNEKRI